MEPDNNKIICFSVLEKIHNILKTLPHKPGVYQFYDKEGVIIYIGKAKSLKSRVSSYFNKGSQGYKAHVLLNKIDNIKFIVVNTESEALLLEDVLIKQNQPRYNVLLKDDKTFPWICIKNENYPRVFLTRKIIKDGSIYFGPYTSAKMVRALLSLVKQLFKLRVCNYNLSETNIKAGKFKVCLEYHIGNCLGPCEGLQKQDDYNSSIESIKQILKGNIVQVKNYLKDLMQEYSEKYLFEEAHAIKEKIELIEKYQSRSIIVNPAIKDLDVCTLLSSENNVYVNFIKVLNGSVVQSHNVEIKRKFSENTDAEILSTVLIDFRSRFKSNAKEVLLNIEPDILPENVKYNIPQRGDKKQLLDLSLRNVKLFKLNIERAKDETKYVKKQSVILEQLQKDLRLNILPEHIECFDNSNIQGTNPVSACVVFKNAKPSKKDYRIFNIKTVEGPDDFASMQEVVRRRYTRLVNEGDKLPQLIIVDGGKGQLSSSYSILKELNIHNEVAIIGIAKRLEEIYFPGDSIPLYIDKNSSSLKLIQHLRNEAHRFGIKHHRNRRSKSSIVSELDEITGIGEKTKTLLLKHYESVDAIKSTSVNDLAKVTGSSRAKKIYEYFNLKNRD